MSAAAAAAGETKQFNPATGEALPSVANTPIESLPHIVNRAREVQQFCWSRMPFAQRAECVLKAATYIKKHQDRATTLICCSTGKTQLDALGSEVLPSIISGRYYAHYAHKVLAPESLGTSTIALINKANTIEHIPLGVVAVISPWNYPLAIPWHEIMMGVMAGNAIVYKVASNVALVGKFMEECFSASGFPPGLITHVVISGAKAGPALLAAGVDKVFFTGSVSVGKQLMRDASQWLTPVSLELGGKDAMIVLEDAHVERAANCACYAGYQNAGQSCAGIERIYVHSSKYDQFVGLLVAKTKALRHGPTKDADMGSLTTKGQLQTVASQVDEAISEGAFVAAQSLPIADCSKGYFFPATVLLNVNHKMRIMREETFGPVLPVMKFDTIDEAIALANDTTYTLTCSVFSESSKNARQVVSRLQTGTVTINSHLYTHGDQVAPWGGWRDTGLGRTHGPLGLKEMCNVRNTAFELLPSSWIPRDLLWYPTSRESIEGVKAVLEMLHPASPSSYITVARHIPSVIRKVSSSWRPFETHDVDAPRDPRQETGRIGALSRAIAALAVLGVAGYLTLFGYGQK